MKINNKKTNHFKLPLLIVGITLIVGIAIGVGIIFLSSPTKLSNTNYEANAGNGNATIKSLTANGSTNNVKKSGNTYNVNVANNVSKVTIKITTANNKATISEPSGLKDKVQEYDLKAGEPKKKKIRVYSANKKNHQDYELVMTRAKATTSSKPKTSSSKASSSSKPKASSSKVTSSSVGKGNTKISDLTVKDAITGASATVKYNSNNDTYSTTVANSISQVKVNVVTKNPKATITEPAGLKGDKAVTWKLEAGKTKTVKIIVKSENGNNKNQYTLKITREAKPKTKSSDATLKSVKIYKTAGYNKITKTGKEIKGDWDKTFNKNKTTYNITLPSGTKDFEIVAYPNDNGAVINKPNGMKNNQAKYTITNKKTIKIAVKAENGTIKDYTFNMTVKGSLSSTIDDKNDDDGEYIEPEEEGNDGDGDYIEPEEENDGDGDYVEPEEENDSDGDYVEPEEDENDDEISLEEIEEEKNTVKKIIVNNEEIKINKGRSTEVVAIVLPGTVTNREVTWETADESIATVDENGMIYGVSAGTTTIIATSVSDPEVQETIDVTINESTVNNTNNINNINNTIDKEKLYDINKDNVINGTDYAIASNIFLNNTQYLNNEKYLEWKNQLNLINPAGIDLNDISSIGHYILYKE